MTAAARKQARPAILRLVEELRDPGEHWKRRAACAGHPRPNIFHPPPARRDDEHSLRRSAAEKRRQIIIAEAKTVCRHCPVTRECLAYATTRNQRYGIWGGLEPKERGIEREER